MQDYSSVRLYKLGYDLITERLPFNEFPQDLSNDVTPHIGNKAPAYLYCGVWCFEKALASAEELEKPKIQAALTEAKSRLNNYITPQIHLNLSTRQAGRSYTPSFQYTPNNGNQPQPSTIGVKTDILRNFR